MDLPVLAGFRDDGSPAPEAARRAARAWLAGGIVGLPTETVYGLAADAQDADAVGRVYAAKGRPPDHPLIVHVAGAEALAGWSAHADPVALTLAEAFWPGPLTLVVARSPRAADVITGGQPTVALRCPRHPVALACLAALVAESGDPARGVAAPSANRFGRVSPTRAADVVAEVGSRLDPSRDLVVDGGTCSVGVESTIVDCTATPPRVLRLGAISQAQVDEVLGRRLWSRAAEPAGPPEGPGSPPGGVRAPGTLASHYAPAARVVLVERPPRGTDDEDWLSEPILGAGAGIGDGGGPGLIAPASVPTPRGWRRLSSPGSAEEYARDLYAALRRADVWALRTVVAVLPERTGDPLDEAVRDRLARAAHGT